jgi:hypothetical protein
LECLQLVTLFLPHPDALVNVLMRMDDTAKLTPTDVICYIIDAVKIISSEIYIFRFSFFAYFFFFSLSAQAGLL